MADKVEDVVEGLIEHIRALDALVRPGAGEHELRTLLSIRDWAMAAQPIHAADRVVLVHAPELTGGWLAHAETLVDGAAGHADRVYFSGDGAWYAMVTFDSAPDFSFALVLDRLRAE